MSLPEISVLMPTYNYASYLPEAIGSVLAQDFQDFELLIIDDASTDNTAGVVKPFCVRDARVNFIINPSNLGMVNNWNECLKRARGRHIKYVFGDDKLSDPQALAKMLALLRNNPGAMLAASARAILDDNSNVIDVCRPLPNGCHNGRQIITECLIENGNLIGEPTSVLFRKEDAQRGFETAYRQFVDLEMWFHLLERGDLVYTRETLCAFRRHAAQQTAVNNATYSIKEPLMLVAAYGTKPWIPARQRLDILYRARRGLRRDPGARPQFLELERQCAGGFGKPGYFRAWLKYIFVRPLENLKRSRQKRSFRRTICGLDNLPGNREASARPGDPNH
ncbi:MAG: glycosyltransferase family 2 protein [Limisphaerales bacterium]